MRAREQEVELQRRITLDEALLAGMETYRNGCNFALYREADGSYWLGFGCYLLVNLVHDDARLLMDWLGGKNAKNPKRQLDGLVKPETLAELLKRPPCECCGAPLFAPTKDTP